MFRVAASRLTSIVASSVRSSAPKTVAVSQVRHSHGPVETPTQFDDRYEAFFNRQDIDGWEIRKAMNDLQGYDLVPEPRIIGAALRACRRVNDHSLAVRYLEAVKDKCGNKKDEIWPYMMAQLKPTMEELGVSSLEEMGYDKPELALEDVFDMH